MVKEGLPFLIIPLFVGLGFLFFGLWIVAIVLFLLAGFMAYFFRDPKRTIPAEEGLVLSAADGRVTRIEDNGNGKLVSVFLSPLNVHINRSPIAGRIEKIEYIPGKKMPATNDEASLLNERNSLTIVGKDMTVVCTQIAGILARRIVCWNKEGDNLESGQKFGMIKFGSRTDVLMPSTVEVQVHVGDRVVGGETIIAKLA
ncbi:MAG: phosphatidylserine decarboxylase [Candidatus Binatia bacterium]